MPCYESQILGTVAALSLPHGHGGQHTRVVFGGAYSVCRAEIALSEHHSLAPTPRVKPERCSAIDIWTVGIDISPSEMYLHYSPALTLSSTPERCLVVGIWFVGIDVFRPRSTFTTPWCPLQTAYKSGARSHISGLPELKSPCLSIGGSPQERCTACVVCLVDITTSHLHQTSYDLKTQKKRCMM